jgi:hypothetical protein
VAGVSAVEGQMLEACGDLDFGFSAVGFELSAMSLGFEFRFASLPVSQFSVGAFG